ncbi:TauD/TfdA family dioxygenase [Micromonospora sp. WMMD1082]|uniref:TauD/TfdA family dioxygenase n=1 Tax=Micromonospora sp. WMMD1082 TaxID=3016104 RepID=UPI0024173047|nr:TauD/TfdA family dioxygenase [Micromonospora sp. WMMD1082]MDG4797549.1 TauD/TfdA family dioxygenase [Micromonospora sp. WMMD1082]
MDAGAAEIDAGLVPAALARDGIVLVRQGGVPQVKELLDDWTEPIDHPHQSREGLTLIAPRDLLDSAENGSGFSRALLSPHTDRSLQQEPPSLVAAVMLAPASDGGESLLVDGARVLRLLQQQIPGPTIAELRLITSKGRSGSAVVDIRAGFASMRYRDDRVAHPDGTDGREDAVAALRHLIRATANTVSLAAGDGYLIHNHRVLHGRTAFKGSRCLVRLLANVKSDHPYAWLNRGFRFANS